MKTTARMTLILVALTLTTLPATALDLKGIELGQLATPSQLTEAFGIESSSCASYKHMAEILHNSTYRCTGGAKLEGNRVSFEVTFNSADVVQEIDASFLTVYYDQLATAATHKWGSPTATTKAVLQNRFGARFDQALREWVQPNGSTVQLFTLDPTDIERGLLVLKLRGEAKADPAASRM